MVLWVIVQCKVVLTFWRNVLPPSSGWKNMVQVNAFCNLPCCHSIVHTTRWLAVLTSANFPECIILHHLQYPAVLPLLAGYGDDKIGLNHLYLSWISRCISHYFVLSVVVPNGNYKSMFSNCSLYKWNYIRIIIVTWISENYCSFFFFFSFLLHHWIRFRVAQSVEWQCNRLDEFDSWQGWRAFSFPQHSDWIWGLLSILLNGCYVEEEFFLSVRLPRHKADHSSLYNAKVNIVWSCTSIPLCVFMA
jgi:hypothetical protein